MIDIKIYQCQYCSEYIPYSDESHSCSKMLEALEKELKTLKKQNKDLRNKK